MRPYLESDCEGIDAAIFSGDVLHDDAERAELMVYVERWARAIAEHEAQAAGAESTPDPSDLPPDASGQA